MLGLKVSARVVWGYSVRLAPQGKGRVAYTFPPPSTVLGAFIASLQKVVGDRRELTTKNTGKKARILSAGEDYKHLFADVFLDVSQIHVKIYGEPSIQNFLYKLRDKEKIRKMGPTEPKHNFIANPAAFAPGGVLNVLYVVDKNVLSGSTISQRDLERAAWGISRFGSKESVAYVNDVELLDLREDVLEDVVTKYSFVKMPEYDIKGTNYTIERVVDWKHSEMGDYTNAKKVLMVYPTRDPKYPEHVGVRVVSKKPIQTYVINHKEEYAIKYVDGDGA